MPIGNFSIMMGNKEYRPAAQDYAPDTANTALSYSLEIDISGNSNLYHWSPKLTDEREDRVKYLTSRTIEIKLGNPSERNLFGRFMDFIFVQSMNQFTTTHFLDAPIPHPISKEIAELCIKLNPTGQDINRIQSSLNHINEIIEDKRRLDSEASKLLRQHRSKISSYMIPLPACSLRQLYSLSQKSILETAVCLEVALQEARERQQQAI